MKIVVTTPTGNVGSKVVLSLLRAGHRPTLFLRDSSKLSKEVLDQVDVVEGSLLDSAALDRAFTGADSVFFLTPPDYMSTDPSAYYRQVAETVSASLNRTGVPRILHLSGAWNSSERGRGLLDGIAITEEILDELDAHVHHLRPGFFFENFGFQLGAIQAGQYYSSLDPNLKLPFVATKDIAETAALWLVNPNWVGKTAQELSGPQLLTSLEALEEVSKGMGHKVEYVHVPKEAVVEGFLQTGASRESAEAYSQMLDAINREGDFKQPKVSETASTTLASWVFENLRAGA